MTEKRIFIKEMPLVVAKLVDYGIDIHIRNEFSNDSATDYVIIVAECCRGKWDDAMKRTPQWFPVSLTT